MRGMKIKKKGKQRLSKGNKRKKKKIRE